MIKFTRSERAILDLLISREMVTIEDALGVLERLTHNTDRSKLIVKVFANRIRAKLAGFGNDFRTPMMINSGRGRVQGAYSLTPIGRRLAKLSIEEPVTEPAE